MLGYHLRVHPSNYTHQIHVLFWQVSLFLFDFTCKITAKFRKKLYIDLLTVGDPFSSRGIAEVYDFIMTYAYKTG